MGHSSKHITASHYLLCAHQINAERYEGMMVFDIVPNMTQMKLHECL